VPEPFKWKDPKPTRPGSKAPNSLSDSDTAACPRYRAEKHHRSGAFCLRDRVVHVPKRGAQDGDEVPPGFPALGIVEHEFWRVCSENMKQLCCLSE